MTPRSPFFSIITLAVDGQENAIAPELVGALAERIPVHPTSSMSRYLKGSVVSGKEAKKLAQALGIDAENAMATTAMPEAH